MYSVALFSITSLTIWRDSNPDLPQADAMATAPRRKGHTKLIKNYKITFADVSGVDVMITIFCDFCQFSAKKLAFFSNTNDMIKFLLNLALF
jgi:hypothetical protein